MDRLAQLHTFVRIVDSGSLSAAARELGIGQSTVSKALSALEAEVGTPLIERTTRSLRLTDAGTTLLAHARSLVDGWDDAVAHVQSDARQVTGCLKLSVPAVFGVRHVVPHLGAFLDANPGVDLDLRLADRYANLLDDDLDVAIRVGLPVPSSFVARRLGGTPRLLVAAPGDVDVSDPDELDDVLVHSGVSRAVWTLTRGQETRRVAVVGRVRADHSEALRQLAVQGHGVALLARWLVAEDLAAGRLVHVLPDWSLPPAPIRAVLPPSRRVPARVDALLAHLVNAWGRDLDDRDSHGP